VADRPARRNGAWYEMVPRSQGVHPGQHGTFKDCIARLPDVAAMGFDVVYLTPIHPIGRTNRKGRNNAVTAAEGDPGSPYAIGSAEGGHDALHPELGTLEDFRAFVAALQSAQHGSRARFRGAVFARPSLAQGPSAMVQETAGRIDALRGEPAQESTKTSSIPTSRRRPRRAMERVGAM
jgi:starch synthase (maltosyl-transferring)